MIRRIRKWGNSLGVRIPKTVAHDVHLQEGASVDLTVENGRVVLAPIEETRKQRHSHARQEPSDSGLPQGELDERLLAEVRRAAAERGCNLATVIEDALREVLLRRKEGSNGGPIELITDGGNGLRPGVNLDSNAALLDLMEGRGAAT